MCFQQPGTTWPWLSGLPFVECILEQSSQTNIVPLSVSGSVCSIGIDKGDDTCTDMLYTGMLVNFETMKTTRQSNGKGKSQSNGMASFFPL